jgi:hypothetical protein
MAMVQLKKVNTTSIYPRRRESNPELPIVQAKKGKFEVGVHHAPHHIRVVLSVGSTNVLDGVSCAADTTSLFM